MRISPEDRVARAYVDEDEGFAQAEIMSALLAVSNQPGVCAINRYSATTWFERGRWPAWRKVLRESGVPLAPVSYGGIGEGEDARDRHWRPYTATVPLRIPGPRTSRILGFATTDAEPVGDHLCNCGTIAGATASHPLTHAARVLDDHGIAIARISADEAGRVIVIDDHPRLGSEESATVLDSISRRFRDHLRSR